MSALSFHCMICFEQFDVALRYPVVLPCGHTYVCKQCAERLDKCMECRTPLHIVLSKNGDASSPPSASRQHHPSASVSRYQVRSPGRYSHHHPHDSAVPKTPPQPPVKRRLPLPKNVVLLSLIEATELAAKEAAEIDQNRLTRSPGGSAPPSDASIVDADVEEEEKIRQGTSLAISESGTYAVAAKEGLEVYPSCPHAQAYVEREGPVSQHDIDSLVRFFHLEHKLQIQSVPSKESKENEAPNNEPLQRLSSGDRVQVVATEDGWAKLARGYGYVRADRHQLVKVGSPVDKACKLEALLRLLTSRSRRLKSEQLEIEGQFVSLMKELQTSLIADEDLTVIASGSSKVAFAIQEVHSEGEKEIRLEEQRDAEPEYPQIKPRPMERSQSPPAVEPSRGFFCSTDVFDTVMPSTPSFSSTAPSLPSADMMSTSEQAQLPPRIRLAGSPSQRIFRSASHPVSTGIRNSAQVWREMRDRPVHAGIDFRTGMSGHFGLMTPKSHPHDFLEVSRNRTEYLGMSNHTGLTMWKPTRKNLRNLIGGGGGGSFGVMSSPSRSSTTESAVVPTGSLPATPPSTPQSA